MYMDATSPTNFRHDEDILPLQNFDPSIRASIERYPRGDEDDGKEHDPRDEFGNERTRRLHIPGDMSTNRPGYFKRLDSEAKMGGGHGAKEVEHKI